MIETKFFKMVDNNAAVALNSMLNGGPGALGRKERQDWTLFLMSILLRSPHSLLEIGSVINGFFKENLEKFHQAAYAVSRQPNDPASVYDFTMTRTPELAHAYKAALPDMIDNDVIGELIMNMRWAMMNLSRARDTILTGDRPCMTSHGLADPMCMLSLPVSPTHIFVAAHDIERLRQLAAQPAQDTVRNSNNCTVKLAVQSVYGRGSDLLTFVEERLRKTNDPVVPGTILRSGTPQPVRRS